MSDDGRLGPNPYIRQPIKAIADLSGRTKEQEKIGYYFDLTAAGQSPHLALIGTRGIGKTSLLNAANTIARRKLLMPVRIDLNENKTEFTGRFWHDFYSTICLEAAKNGCWGGLGSPIYEALFTMLHARTRVAPDKIVLQFPAAVAAHIGQLDELHCSDSLIIHDLTQIQTELQLHGMRGFVVLVDEADCLGANKALLQMYRNIFQRIDGISLVMAGTEAVFSVLSDVFSPIPRQFHRIEVGPFANRAGTSELVLKALAEDPLDIGPTQATINELHALCAGDPSELQLYCHHMYKKVQEGVIPRMSLHPKVFWEVLKEYRSHAPANLEAVIKAISTLPDELLFKSKWLRRKVLELQENVSVEVLGRELRTGVRLTESERSELSNSLSFTYSELHRRGILLSESRLSLVGEPLTLGFWKSFVEVEKEKRWSWDLSTFQRAIPILVIIRMVQAFSSVGANAGSEFSDDSDSEKCLRELRSGIAPQELEIPLIVDLMNRTLTCRSIGRPFATDLTVEVRFIGKVSLHRIRYSVEQEDTSFLISEANTWISSRSDILSHHELEVRVIGSTSWLVPSDEEMHRLAMRAHFHLPEKHFGMDPISHAVELFESGELVLCAEEFRKLADDLNRADCRNNLAYCLLLMGGNDEGAVEQLKLALETEYSPLWEHNLAVALCILRQSDLGLKHLRHALEKVRAKAETEDPLCMLILNSDCTSVSSHSGVPIDVAIWINMSKLNAVSPKDATAGIREHHAEMQPSWVSLLADGPTEMTTLS